MQIIYGMDTSDEDGAKYFRLVSRVASIAEMVMFPDPAGYLLEAFPVLRHVPAWVPGMGIKRRIQEAKEFIRSTLETLHTVSVTSASVRVFFLDRAQMVVLTCCLTSRTKAS